MRNKNEPKNIRLAFYFFLLVVFIVLVSLVFKASDILRHSKFDGKHTFSVAVLEKNQTDIIVISPQEGKMTSLALSPKLDLESVTEQGIPSDGYIKSSNDGLGASKSVFLKTILQRNSTQTNLTILDLLRLSLFSQSVGGDKFVQESLNIKDSEFKDEIGKLFVDPTIDSEKESILITNSTNTPGLGNKVAKYIGNMGGNVVLVNSSPNTVKNSIIYYKNKSYTVDRLSKSLGIKKQMKEMNTISDITVIIGEDKASF